MTKNFKKNINVIVIVMLVLQLIILYLIKYYNQDLSLSYFSLIKTGNLINLFIYVGIIIGIYILNRNVGQRVSKKNLIIFLSTSYFLLLVSLISTKIDIISSSVYLYDQPGNKVMTGTIFLCYCFTLLYFLVYLWKNIFNKEGTSFLKNLLGSMLILVISLIVILIYVDNVSYTSDRWVLKKNKNNIAVVLGAAVWSGNVPSPTLSSRVDKALDLLNNGFAGKIVLTGGKAPGELSESEVAFEYARAKGVDTSKVIIENVTSSTSDQIRWIAEELITNQKNIEDIIIVSDPYHLPRAIEISKFYNLDIKVAESSHKQEIKDKVFTKIRESIAIFNFWNFAL